MKTISNVFFALALGVIPCLAQEKLALDEANSAHTYSPAQFKKQVAVDPHEGDLIRIKFNGRLADISNGPDGTKIGTVAGRDGNNYDYNEADLQVQIPPEGLAWFQHVGIFNYSVYEKLAVKTYVVYGRVKVAKDGSATVRLVGTEVRHDLDGDSLVWKL